MTKAELTAAENAAGMQRGRPFLKGQSGNPAGKRPGTRHRATMAAEALLDGEAAALTRKAIDKAMEGDAGALRICLDRILPPRKDRPVRFSLPQINTPADAAKASAALIEAAASGVLTPVEASELGKLVDVFVKAVQTGEIEDRLARLENGTR